MIKQLVLVVEDEESIQTVIRTYLESAGFRVACVDDGQEALNKLHELDPTLVILDLNLPGMDGMEVAARMRELSEVYILMLTARSEEADRVAGLRIGADDYLVKPFSPRELVARVEAILRRSRSTAVARTNRLEFDTLTIDPDSYEVYAKDKQVELTSTEFSLLWELARHHGRVLSRDQLLSRVWGEDFYGNDRVVDVYVGQVRRKLEAATGYTMIETVRGVGYKFKL